MKTSIVTIRKEVEKLYTGNRIRKVSWTTLLENLGKELDKKKYEQTKTKTKQFWRL